MLSVEYSPERDRVDSYEQGYEQGVEDILNALVTRIYKENGHPVTLEDWVISTVTRMGFQVTETQEDGSR